MSTIFVLKTNPETFNHLRDNMFGLSLKIATILGLEDGENLFQKAGCLSVKLLSESSQYMILEADKTVPVPVLQKVATRTNSMIAFKAWRKKPEAMISGKIFPHIELSEVKEIEFRSPLFPQEKENFLKKLKEKINI